MADPYLPILGRTSLGIVSPPCLVTLGVSWFCYIFAPLYIGQSRDSASCGQARHLGLRVLAFDAHRNTR